MDVWSETGDVLLDASYLGLGAIVAKSFRGSDKHKDGAGECADVRSDFIVERVRSFV